LSEIVVHTDGVALSGEDNGERIAVGDAGTGGANPVVQMHGLTATRRYVTMGSRTLERAGHRVIAYDARGHGRSTPAPDRAYGYERLSCDLRAVLDRAGVERAVLAGVSMGAHTAVRFALESPERVAGLVLITPAYEPSSLGTEQYIARWDALARGLREEGVDGFVRANQLETLPEAWRETVDVALRQRMSGHEHLDAVADALEAVPRSRPFDDMAQLTTISAPTVIVASRDEADPLHPLAVGERYAQLIPGARLVVEEAGPPPRSPIAWQGGQISKLIAALAAPERM
jgi:pimeloyl-ACP methyl ester carboxylesterase